MNRRVRLILLALALVLWMSALGSIIWYQADRSGMLAALCEAGLPNLSRPAAIKAEDLGCAIVGPRRRIEGVLLTGFEASNLFLSDLGPAPPGGGFTGSTWWTCNQQSGCDRRLDRQLSEEIPGLCDTGLAHVTAYGWATETPGRYGHLGVYARQFFVDEVVDVGPPPAQLVARLRRDRGQLGHENCLR